MFDKKTFAIIFLLTSCISFNLFSMEGRKRAFSESDAEPNALDLSLAELMKNRSRIQNEGDENFNRVYNAFIKATKNGNADRIKMFLSDKKILKIVNFIIVRKTFFIASKHNKPLIIKTLLENSKTRKIIVDLYIDNPFNDKDKFKRILNSILNKNILTEELQASLTKFLSDN